MRSRYVHEYEPKRVSVSLAVDVVAAAVAAAATGGQDVCAFLEALIARELGATCHPASASAVEPALIDAFCALAEIAPELLPRPL